MKTQSESESVFVFYGSSLLMSQRTAEAESDTGQRSDREKPITVTMSVSHFVYQLSDSHLVSPGNVRRQTWFHSHICSD